MVIDLHASDCLLLYIYIYIACSITYVVLTVEILEEGINY